MIPIITATHHWVCPNCPFEDITNDPRPHSRMHHCKGLHGLIAPLIEKGTEADVRVVEREDYIGTEDVQMHEGRPIMSVITEREDGQDVLVFAPRARNA